MPVDYLTGAKKIKNVMRGTAIYICRVCGRQYKKFSQVESCKCKKERK